MQDGKFHPHTKHKGVRKSRDNSTKEQGVRMKRNESKTVYYKSLNKQELEQALVSKQKIIEGMDEILKSKFQDKSSEHYREGLRLQEVNKKELVLIKKLLKKSGERKERDNNAEILRNRIASFNRQHPVKLIEYGDAGGKSKGLKFEGTHSFIAGVMTRDEAIKTLEFFTTYFNALQSIDRDRTRLFE